MMLRQPNQRKTRCRKQKHGNSDVPDPISSWGRRSWYWWLSWIAFIAALTWAAYPVDGLWQRIRIEQLRIGEPSPQTVISPVAVEYEDHEASQQAQEAAISAVPLVYHLETNRLADVAGMFRDIRNVRGQELLQYDERKAQLQRTLLIGHLLTDEVLDQLLSLSEAQIDQAEQDLQRVLGQVLQHGVIRGVPEDGNGLPSFASDVAQRMQPYTEAWEAARAQRTKELGREATDDEVAELISVELYPGGDIRTVGQLYTWNEARGVLRKLAASVQDAEVRSVVSEIADALIRPNVMAYDKVLTETRRASVAQAVAPVREQIQQGQTVVGKGQIVTEQQYEALKRVQNHLELSGAHRWRVVRTAGGIALLLTLLTALMMFYLNRYRLGSFREYRDLLAFCLTILLTTLTGKAFLLLSDAILSGSSLTFDLALTIPATMTAALVAILFGPSSAVAAAILVAAVIGLMGIGQVGSVFMRMFVVLAGGFVAILSLSQVRRRRELTVAGLYVAGVNALCIAGAGLMMNVPPLVILQNAGLGVFSGLIVAVVTPGLLPLFEATSTVTTDIKLLELSDLNHPLLKELEQRAIGTYHHSMNVSKLAEAAAKAVGANELLARVGAYYHDIGKISYPRYFTENQEGGANPHDNLGPARSAKIIANHVTAGIQMAREHKLPRLIEDMIPQHHGTSLISFFHLKALQNDKNNDFSEDDFRYVGPKPQSREASIMMLADSVEAASRSLYNRIPNPTPQDIREVIQQIISKKIAEGQLDQSLLTLRDRQILSRTFERVLCGFYHSRIDYPKELRDGSPLVKAAMTNGVDKQRPVYPVQ